MTIIDFGTERAKRDQRWQLLAVSPELTREQADRLAGYLAGKYGWLVDVQPAGWKEQPPSTS